MECNNYLIVLGVVGLFLIVLVIIRSFFSMTDLLVAKVPFLLMTGHLAVHRSVRHNHAGSYR